MLSYRKNLCLLVIIFLLRGCGFTPLYSKHSYTNLEKKLLASVAVKTVDNRTGQIFRIAIEDKLNPLHIEAEPRYDLVVDLITAASSLAIEKDRSISRYQIILTANYKLIDLATKKTIRKGVLRRQNGYDKAESEYSTFVAETASSNKAMEVLAQDLSILIISSVLENSKNKY